MHFVLDVDSFWGFLIDISGLRLNARNQSLPGIPPLKGVLILSWLQIEPTFKSKFYLVIPNPLSLMDISF